VNHHQNLRARDERETMKASNHQRGQFSTAGIT
jgi:hypothetical protein